MKRKLCSSCGFTMLESLAALAIVAIMLTAVVAGTAASVAVYKQSTALSESKVLSSTLFESLSDELRFATDITVVGDGDNHLSTFTSASYGFNTSFSNEAGRIKISGGDLISDLTYTGLDAAADITYAAGVFDVVLVVTDPSREDAACSRAEFSVMPLNP
ncbi:MAG: type II secretion system protein [Clostridia bacterium]|nr:type II secretion system protein [Clostridia bacterium]